MIEHSHLVTLHTDIIPPICKQCEKVSEYTCESFVFPICLKCCKVIRDSWTLMHLIDEGDVWDD